MSKSKEVIKLDNVTKLSVAFETGAPIHLNKGALDELVKIFPPAPESAVTSSIIGSKDSACFVLSGTPNKEQKKFLKKWQHKPA